MTNHRGFYLVWNQGGNVPRVQHPTKARADAEALRLSVRNPEHSFYVLKAVNVTRSKRVVKNETTHTDTDFDHEIAARKAAEEKPAGPPGWSGMGATPIISGNVRYDVIYNDKAKFYDRSYNSIVWHNVAYWRYSTWKRPPSW